MDCDRDESWYRPNERGGYCYCGCGELAPVASKTDRSRFQKKGEPIRFIRGHRTALQRDADPYWSGDIGCYVVPLTKGAVALVDREDIDAVAGRSWHFNSGYAWARTPSGLVSMHRAILSPPGGMFVDHINGNRLDNRRANLRVATSQQNNMNRRNGFGESRFKGVSRSRNGKRWRAYIKIGRKQEHIGTFDTEFEAAAAYNDRAVMLFGEFANINNVQPHDLGEVSPDTPNEG